MAATDAQKQASLRYYYKNRDKLKEATRQRSKAWREQNQEHLKSPEYKDGINAYKREKRQDVQAVVRARKLALGCSECSFKAHHAALEWHHPNDDKEIDVSLCMSIGAAEREMEKCIVLCSNCHKIHHWNTRMRDVL